MTEILQTVKKLKEENIRLWEKVEEKELLLTEKERNIKLLMRENEKLQENYNLIVSNIVDKDTIIDTLDKIKPEIVDIKTKNIGGFQETKSSYAYVIKNVNVIKPNITNLEYFTMIPKLTQQTKETQQDFRNNIDTEKLKINVDSIKLVKNGGIEIICQEKSDSLKLREEIENCLAIHETWLNAKLL